MTDNLSRYTAEGLRSLCKSLQMVLMGRFCKFQKAKPWIAICKRGSGQTVVMLSILSLGTRSRSGYDIMFGTT